jgi:hypothetical protein
MTKSMKAMMMSAAVSGLLGGSTLTMHAATFSPAAGIAGHAMLGQSTGTQTATAKHSCKGKNDCKGQGGGDAKHAGKNSCKGKGACATDGSTPPKS